MPPSCIRNLSCVCNDDERYVWYLHLWCCRVCCDIGRALDVLLSLVTLHLSRCQPYFVDHDSLKTYETMHTAMQFCLRLKVSSTQCFRVALWDSLQDHWYAPKIVWMLCHVCFWTVASQISSRPLFWPFYFKIFSDLCYEWWHRSKFAEFGFG